MCSSSQSIFCSPGPLCHHNELLNYFFQRKFSIKINMYFSEKSAERHSLLLLQAHWRHPVHGGGQFAWSLWPPPGRCCCRDTPSEEQQGWVFEKLTALNSLLNAHRKISWSIKTFHSALKTGVFWFQSNSF